MKVNSLNLRLLSIYCASTPLYALRINRILPTVQTSKISPLPLVSAEDKGLRFACSSPLLSDPPSYSSSPPPPHLNYFHCSTGLFVFTALIAFPSAKFQSCLLSPFTRLSSKGAGTFSSVHPRIPIRFRVPGTQCCQGIFVHQLGIKT